MLSKRKVLWLTGFHPNVRRENFCGYALSALKILPCSKHLLEKLLRLIKNPQN